MVFLLFGYLSLLRILYRQHFNAPFSELFAGMRDSQGLHHIGSSAFFVSLPATSLLLFWGWGPALLWLVVFHLLADSLVNLQVTAVNHSAALSEYLVASDSSARSYLMRALLLFYLMLLLAVALTMLAQLIDKEAGLLLALVGLIPAYRVLRNNNSRIPRILKQSGAFAVLMISLLFANKLGFAIYGDWAPLGESISWLRFNNTTILAAMLLIGGVMLASNDALSEDVSRLAGAVVIATIIILIVKLIWLRPLIDAPLNSIQLHGGSEEVEKLPLFLGLCMFLFAGFTTLFFRVFNSTAPSEAALSPPADFGRVQAESLLQLMLAVLLVLCLASALGIGAWKTHYLNWSHQANFLDHLNLAISSLLKLIHSGATAGNFVHTIIMAGLCIAGLSFLRVCVKALSLTQNTITHRVGDSTSISQMIIQSRVLPVFATFIASSYLIVEGISIDVWLLIGILSWIIVIQLITSMTVSMKDASLARSVYGGQCIILIGLGGLQTLGVSIQWFAAQQYLYAASGFSLLLIGAYLWWSPVRAVVVGFGKTENKTLFD